MPSDTQTDDTARPWGTAPVASGVEALFLHMREEIAKLHARINELAGHHAEAPSEVASDIAQTDGPAIDQGETL